jgi:hypothetical protein
MQSIIALLIVTAGAFVALSPQAKRYIAFRLLASADAQEARREEYRRSLNRYTENARLGQGVKA